MTAPDQQGPAEPRGSEQPAGPAPRPSDPFAAPPAAPAGWSAPTTSWATPTRRAARPHAAAPDATPTAATAPSDPFAPRAAHAPAPYAPAPYGAAPGTAAPSAAPFAPYPPLGTTSSPFASPAPATGAGAGRPPFPAPPVALPGSAVPPVPLPADPGAAPVPGLVPDGALAGGFPGQPAPATRRRRRRFPVALVAGVVVAGFGAGLLGGLLGARLGQDETYLADAGLPAAVGSGTGSTGAAPEGVAGIAAGVLPSVVSIEVTAPDGAATGSGFVLRQDGYILTNHHVVAGSTAAGATVVVLLADGSQLAATVVGSTADYDLAVLKVDAQGLTPLALGDSDVVQVGDPVVAVGAPLGLAGTVTSGIVSAKNRPVAAGDGAESTAFINAIQTDAAINPGNSGGPLVNAAGEVVGINSAIAQPPGTAATSGGSIGLGFAIPSNQARRTAEQLIETGRATYPVIGVLLDGSYTGEGVQVATSPQAGQQPVTPGGPADRSGIRAGDVILSIDGRPVTASDELIVAIRARTPGEAVVLRVRDDSGAERDVRVVLDESAQG